MSIYITIISKSKKSYTKDIQSLNQIICQKLPLHSSPAQHRRQRGECLCLASFLQKRMGEWDNRYLFFFNNRSFKRVPTFPTTTTRKRVTLDGRLRNAKMRVECRNFTAKPQWCNFPLRDKQIVNDDTFLLTRQTLVIPATTIVSHFETNAWSMMRRWQVWKWKTYH